MNFELKQSEKNQQFYFSFRNTEGKALLTSEGYTQKSSAKNGIESVKKNAADASRFVKKEAKNGTFYFTLLAGNGQIVAKSPMFKTEAVRDQAIADVMSKSTKATTNE